MVKLAEYIDKIEISSLWSGHKRIVWQLKPGVNVLSGRNGEGKSTILNKMAHRLSATPSSGEIASGTALGVKLTFFPADATGIRYDIIRSFDRGLMTNDVVSKVPDARIRTELDWQLYQLQRRFLNYQVDVANRMIEKLTSGDAEAQREATEAAQHKTRFLDLVDELFAETGKKIDRQSNELVFTQWGERLEPYLLSSGEKQILIILLTALTEDRLPYVIFMDEPEASLHFEWQKRLIQMVRELNPNAQIILTTHSPAVIMDGWADVVTEVSDITF